jgi:glucose-1-phosphate thymidylyltransferase
MVPVAGRPILDWLVEALANAGVDEIQVVVGYKGNRIRSFLEDGSTYDVDVSYVRQNVLLGSAAALSVALKDGGVPDEALVMGADNIVDRDLVAALTDAGPNALATTETRQPSKYGLVHVTGDEVDGIDEKPPIEGQALISTGATLLDAEVLREVPGLVDRGMLGMANVLDHVAREGPGLHAVRNPGLWLDAVYPWDLLELTAELAPHAADGSKQPGRTMGSVVVAEGATIEPGATVRGPTSIGANARVEAGAVVNASVIMEDVRVGAGAHVDRSVLGDGSIVRGGATLACGEGVAETGEDVHPLDDVGAMVGEGCTVEGAAQLLPGTLVGNRARVRAGAQARRRVDEDGEVH